MVWHPFFVWSQHAVDEFSDVSSSPCLMILMGDLFHMFSLFPLTRPKKVLWEACRKTNPCIVVGIPQVGNFWKGERRSDIVPLLVFFIVPQQQHFAMGSLAQISSGAIRCSFDTRFWARFRRVQRVPVQILRLGSGRFWCRAQGGFWKVPVRGSGGFRSGAEARWGFGRFWCKA